jgi:hypothetical protein
VVNRIQYTHLSRQNEIIMFSLRSTTTNPIMKVSGEHIELKDTVRLLGVLFDKKRPFKDHFAKIQKSSRLRMYQLDCVAGRDFVNLL